MSSFLILLTLSALSGFVLGLSHFSWRAIMAAGAVLAPLSAVVLQNQGFGALSGIAITVACLVINQAAYVVGAIRVNDGPTSGSVLPSQRADNELHDDRNEEIRHQNEKQKDTHLDIVANQRQATLTPRFQETNSVCVPLRGISSCS
jgi:hypothetical protein